MDEKVIPVRSVQMQEWYSDKQIKRQERWADIAIMAIFTGFFGLGVLVGWAICQL